MTTSIRPAEAGDVTAIGRLAEATDLFPVGMLGDMVAGYLDGSKPDLWLIVEDDGIQGFGFVGQSGWRTARGIFSRLVLHLIDSGWGSAQRCWAIWKPLCERFTPAF